MNDVLHSQKWTPQKSTRLSSNVALTVIYTSTSFPPHITSPPISGTKNTMAGDTRDSSSKYETFTSPPPSANSLPPGSGQNTAGSHLAPPKITDAIKTVRLEDFKQVHMYPCARDAFIFGIGSGFGIGGLRFALGGAFSL
jgi:cytochrome c oxidase assembly protein subunit 20